VRLRDVLKLYLADNVKARVLNSDGIYERVAAPTTEPLRVQRALMDSPKKR